MKLAKIVTTEAKVRSPERARHRTAQLNQDEVPYNAAPKALNINVEPSPSSQPAHHPQLRGRHE